MRSGMLIVRNITMATANPEIATLARVLGIGAVRLATTCTARGPSSIRVRRIATSSSAGVIVLQPEIRSTLHAGAVRPHP